ncbi:proteasome subunit alpha [Tessaracoccus sp. MC1865]|uniref:proteasome subunit alpha n=1 Tax=Tessaracoccus sp. MC1865 TaxID=2760310 RepID=UPI00160094D5|nr:proteasome subunit alpha [Tessaracoccus sp. MC1865]MBB1484688.1 proteasome subunit alpha [Tessaracoccus sp. MC1865]QTO36368.1 proteasome subunit alpha [Tessaracoccus sp. MC1865]
MSLPFYVSPEQQMLDRAEFARKGIARGRAVVVLRYAGGIAMVAENHSTTLNKVAEIYDRIGFAAVGRYNEFETLRIAGIRHADLRGYSYDRRDVTGRSLAGAYSQLLGGAFASGGEKPYEVELIVAELGEQPIGDVLYRISYDGVITDEQELAVIGGDAERVADVVRAGFAPDAPLRDAVALAGNALHSDQLEVAVLERGEARRRTFRRLSRDEVARG